MKKILHLFRTEKFTEGFINLMTNFSEERHEFWVFGENYLYDNCSYLKLENVKYYPRIDIKINKRSTEGELNRYDLIIYHGVFDEILIEYFYTHKSLLKKLILYFWGGDKESLPTNWKKRKEKKYVIENSAAVVTIISQDYLDLKKQYRIRGKNFCAKYYNNKLFETVENISNTSQIDVDTINIQVGNSATITNDHLNVLKLLSKFRVENIKVYVPLSYGERMYAEQVIKYGKEVFGDKFVPIRQLMPMEEYHKFLRKMHVGIFNMKRQQALGNINALMMFGCKIYFNKDSLLWDFYGRDMGCVIGEIGEIYKMDFKSFIELSEKDKAFNKIQCRETFGREESIKDWKNIFESF